MSIRDSRELGHGTTKRPNYLPKVCAWKWHTNARSKVSLVDVCMFPMDRTRWASCSSCQAVWCFNVCLLIDSRVLYCLWYNADVAQVLSTDKFVYNNKGRSLNYAQIIVRAASSGQNAVSSQNWFAEAGQLVFPIVSINCQHFAMAWASECLGMSGYEANDRNWVCMVVVYCAQFAIAAITKMHGWAKTTHGWKCVDMQSKVKIGNSMLSTVKLAKSCQSRSWPQAQPGPDYGPYWSDRPLNWGILLLSSNKPLTLALVLALANASLVPRPPQT